MSYEFRPMRSIIYVDVIKEQYRHKLQHWLYYHHIPDSISKFGPYCSKYTFYNALPVPPEGHRFGTRRMQMTEHYWTVNEMLPEMKNNAYKEYMPLEVLQWMGMVPETVSAEGVNIGGDEHRSAGGQGDLPPFFFGHVPMNWENDYKGTGRMISDGPNYRWQFAIKYPEGISFEEGESWFQEALVPYFQERPEVLRFLSSQIIQEVVGCKFHRLVEMWFDGPQEWYEAAVTGAASMAKPTWAQQESFPFFKSNFNIIGMFLSDMATSDNMTQYRGYITMR